MNGSVRVPEIARRAVVAFERPAQRHDIGEIAPATKERSGPRPAARTLCSKLPGRIVTESGISGPPIACRAARQPDLGDVEPEIGQRRPDLLHPRRRVAGPAPRAAGPAPCRSVRAIARAPRRARPAAAAHRREAVAAIWRRCGATTAGSIRSRMLPCERIAGGEPARGSAPALHLAGSTGATAWPVRLPSRFCRASSSIWRVIRSASSRSSLAGTGRRRPARAGVAIGPDEPARQRPHLLVIARLEDLLLLLQRGHDRLLLKQQPGRDALHRGRRPPSAAPSHGQPCRPANDACAARRTHIVQGQPACPGRPTGSSVVLAATSAAP